MSNINEILRKAECFQEDDVSDSAIDSNEQYRLGRICYSMKSFNEAKGRRWPVSTGNCEVELYCVRL